MTRAKTVLSIAGTDPSGGAGLHADLKTFAAHRVYGMGVVTAVVAQNTRGVSLVERVSPAMLRAQLSAVFDDIFPDAVKVGMIADAESVSIVASALRAYRARRVVVDTVMVSSSGHRLLAADALEAYQSLLLPLASVITPNVPEAECLCGFAIKGRPDMERAAYCLSRRFPASILIKGGHLALSCDDFLLSDGASRWFGAERVPTKDTHGTGCTLSSAIAANLALGLSVAESAARAKAYLVGALSAPLSLGSGHGPLNHGWQGPMAFG